MYPRLAAALLVSALAAAPSAAFGQEPGQAAPAPQQPQAPAQAQPQAQARGAIVVAASEGAGPAARSLALEVYKEADLRPAIDDATARALAGDAVAEGAPARVKEIAELRASIPRAGAEPVQRRVLASLGTELGASLVIAVTMDGTRPIARVLRPATASFERVELGATVEIAPDGARSFKWPGVATTLRGFLPAAAPAPTPAPLAPKAESAPAAPGPFGPKPFYKSPWFWGSIGGAVALGLTVFAVSKATSSSHDVHLEGKVGP